MSKPWPQSAGDPVAGFIKTLRKIGEPANAASTKNHTTAMRTPYSLQDIKSGAAALTKLWALAVAAAGGTPALFAIIQGTTNRFGGSRTDVPLVRAAFVLAGAGLLAAVGIAISIIVRGDVQARATAHAARVTAEGNIVVAALTHYRFTVPLGWLIQMKDGTYLRITDMKVDAAGAVTLSSDGVAVATNQIAALIDMSSIQVP